MTYPGGGGRNVNWRLTVPLLVVVVAYVILGAAIFFFLEQPSRRTHENAKRKVLREFRESYPEVTQARVLELLNNFSREVYTNSAQMHTYDLSYVSGENPHNWDFGTAVYFVVTVITTIGYGDVVPVSSEGRIFCCVYALIGIPTCLVLLANVGGALYIVIKRMDNRVDCLRENPRRAQAVRCVALFTIGLCFFVLLPSYMFSEVENWGFANSVYYAFITLSTVGLGDFVADIGTSGRKGTPWYLAVLVIWLFLGLAWLSTTINSTQELITELLREETHSDQGTEERITDEAEQTTTQIRTNIKTVSTPSIDSRTTMETAITETPSPHYNDRLAYGTSEFLQYTPAPMTNTSPHPADGLSYKLGRITTSNSVPSISSTAKITGEGNAVRSRAGTPVGQALPMVSYSSPTYESYQDAMEISPSKRSNQLDKGVQVNLTYMKSRYHSNVHTGTPTGVASVYPIPERQQRRLDVSKPGDIVLMTLPSDRQGDTTYTVPSLSDDSQNMWW